MKCVSILGVYRVGRTPCHVELFSAKLLAAFVTGVILNKDPDIHIKFLKPSPVASALIDRWDIWFDCMGLVAMWSVMGNVLCCVPNTCMEYDAYSQML